MGIEFLIFGLRATALVEIFVFLDRKNKYYWEEEEHITKKTADKVSAEAKEKRTGIKQKVANR